jgi:hypothetical protein
MSHLRCPSCGIQISVLRAPTVCPRCLVRRRGRFEMVAVSVFAPPPSQVVPSSKLLKGDDARVQAR